MEYFKNMSVRRGKQHLIASDLLYGIRGLKGAPNHALVLELVVKFSHYEVESSSEVGFANGNKYRRRHTSAIPIFLRR